MRLNKKIIFGAVLFATFGFGFFAVHTPTAHAYVYCQDSSGNVTKKAFECKSGEKTVSEADFNNPNKYDNVAQPSDSVCSLSGTNGLAICVSNLVYYIMVGVFSSIAYICAFFFDLAVQLSLNSTTYALGFLTTSWTIIRDLSNMAFIFILIYIAVQVILLAETSQTIKTLVAVIVVALLINFSFFFTRVAIDAGNLLALQFYNAIEGHAIGASPGSGLDSTLNGGKTNATNTLSGFTAVASAGNTKDLTASIMDGIQVQNIVNSESFKRYTDPSNKNQSSMYILISLSTIYIAVGIAFAILAGAFLFAGAKFVMRIVGLWFVIILSPLALVAAALPHKGANDLFHKWLNHLINFSFYPAAFLFMFFVLSRFMKELNAGGNFLSGVFGASSATGFSDGTFGFITILSAIANVGVRLGFVIAMMYLALSAADMLAKSRSDMTQGWARTAAGWMGNAITGGGLAWAGQKTLGRIPALSGRSFDIRNAPIIKQAITPLLKKYEPTTRTPHGTYGAVPINWGAPASTKDMAKAATEASKERERERRDAENKKRDEETAAAIKRVAADAKAGRASAPKDTERVKNLSKRELEGLKEAEVKSIVHAVNENQLKTLTDGEKFSDKTKDELRKDWNEKNSSSPLLKSQKILATELRTLSASIATAHVKAALTDVDTNSARGHNLKGSSVTEMRENINDQIAQLRSDIRTAAPGVATKDLQKDLAKLTNALDSVKRLGDERGKVPAGAGGLPNAGEFVVA